MENQMHDATEAGKETMRDLIRAHGIGHAIATTADRYAAPANYTERDMLAGMLLAAYEAGMVTGANLTRDKEIVESLARQSEFYANNPRVDATPELDEV